MKQLKTLLLLCVIIALSSCENKNELDTFKQLTEKLFSYSRQEKYDSLELIYPGIQTDYLDLNSDSVRIVQINHTDDHKIAVQLIKNFSPDSDPNTNKQKSITLNFEKCDNVTVMVNYTIILGEKYALVDKWHARFILNNPTEYSCLGFSVALTLSDVGDGSLQANLNGVYENTGAILQAYSKNNYSISFTDTDLKNPNSSFKSYISAGEFHITPEAVEKYTILHFNGSEYDNYTKDRK